MAFLNGIFGKQQPQQQPQQQGNQPQHPSNPQGQQGNNSQQGFQPNNNSSGSGGPAGSQQTPQNSNYSGAGNNPANPLDPFMGLMTPSKEVLEQQQQHQEAQSASLFGDQFTPDNVNKAISGNNFAANLDPQKMTAALGGDVNAFQEILNSVAQNAASMSIQASRGMVEHGVKTGTERFGTDLDSRFRDYDLRKQTPKNAALQHPLGKALLSTAAKSIAKANPRMSAEEVHSKAEEMFTQFGSLLNPQKQQGEEGTQGGKAPMDWEAFLDESSQ